MAGVAGWGGERQVCSPTLHGTSGKEIQLVAVRGPSDPLSDEPVDRHDDGAERGDAARPEQLRRSVDLLAKIRWTVRTSGFHQVRPVLKLADGTWLVGRSQRPGLRSTSTSTTCRLPMCDGSSSTSRASSRSATGWRSPDLRKVDQVGFADLMPGSGHGAGGYVNVGRIEVYGRPVKR